MSATREHLLGYLLGALDAAEHDAVERELAANPQLAEELARLSQTVGRWGLTDEPEMFDSPAGLAARTCHFVAREARPQVELAGSEHARAAFSLPSASDYAESRRFTWADLLVAAAVLVAGFAVLFPALSNSRFQAQMIACQDRMRTLGVALHQHASFDAMHWFPRIERDGNRGVAGAYAPILVDQRLVLDPRTFVCPSSDLAAHLERLQIPSLDQLDAANGQLLADYHGSMGGSYGYSFGFIKEGDLLPQCDLRRPNHVILADAPQPGQPGRASLNHGGCGQNLLCEDGHVKWLPALPSTALADDPFHNRNGDAAAGLDCDDASLGASHERPLPIRLIKE
jgi:hypothetical protein